MNMQAIIDAATKVDQLERQLEQAKHDLQKVTAEVTGKTQGQPMLPPTNFQPHEGSNPREGNIARLPERQAEVFEIFSREKGVFRPKEIAEKLGRNQNGIGVILRQLIDKGLIVSRQRGLYQLASVDDSEMTHSPQQGNTRRDHNNNENGNDNRSPPRGEGGRFVAHH